MIGHLAFLAAEPALSFCKHQRNIPYQRIESVQQTNQQLHWPVDLEGIAN